MMAITIAVALGGGCRRHHAPIVDDTPPAPEQPTVDERAAATNTTLPTTPTTASVTTIKRLVDAGTLNGDVAGPKAADLDQKLALVRPNLNRCLDLASNWPAGKPLPLTVTYTILPTGKTDNIAIVSGGPTLAPLAEQCMRGQLTQMVFAPFGGGALDASFRLNYQRTTP